MKLVIPGGSGHVGALLLRHFLPQGHEVVVLSRGGADVARPGTTETAAARAAEPEATPAHGRGRCRIVPWNGEHLGAWAAEVDGADVVINLAGRSVNCRYTPQHRREILESRVRSTRIIGEAIARARRPPKLWLQSSTATIYGHRYDAPNDEASGLIGVNADGYRAPWGFSVEVAKAWELAAQEFPLPTTKLVLLRSALTLSPDRGSIFDVLRSLVRVGLGGTNGDGRQYVSWIHGADFARALDWIIAAHLAGASGAAAVGGEPGPAVARPAEALSGPINLAAPCPLPNRDFMRALRQAAGAKVGLPATAGMLEIGAFFLRTETELLLKSRRVVPGKLLASGFTFQFPEWSAAAEDLYRARGV